MRDPRRLSWAKAAFRFLASLKLAVTLIVLLAAVLAVATFIESAKGRDYSRWCVYNTDWFVALLGMLGANILAATLIRFPWKPRQFGFVVTHFGLLVLLAGSIGTFLYGIDAMLALEQGETSDRVILRDTNRFAVWWKSTPDQQERPLSAFLFHPGPEDWPEGKSLPLGAINGIELRVTRYLAHARPSEEWSPTTDGNGIAAVRFSLAGTDSGENVEQWLTSAPLSGSTAVGSARVEFRRAEADTMVDDFLTPPATGDLDPQGMLAIHYQGRVQRVPVSSNVGKKIPLADSGASVEIASFLPNAKLQADGSFVNVGPMPVHPALELKVYLPGEQEPIREYARPSFANPGGMRAVKCPVKFWYHHSKVAAESAVELLATSDGKLYCRVGNGKYQSRGEVHAGDLLEAWPNTSLAIASFLPHAQKEFVFTPVKPSRGDRENYEAAAQIELTAGNTTQRLWLQRGDQGGMPLPVKTADGTLVVSYGYESLPLGFSLTLTKFTRGLNPGGMGDASFASTVQLQDDSRKIDRTQDISMNEPLVHGKYTFYQSGILPSGTGTALTVAYDPGLLLKYLGSIMTCGGTLIMFITRSKLAKILPFISSAKTTTTKEQVMRRAIAASVALMCLCGSAWAGTATPGANEIQFDWSAWQSLPVQDGGRQKPLDSLAWETWRLLGNRVSFTDPETNQTLDATAFYVASMLESPTWDKKPSATLPSPSGRQAGLEGNNTLPSPAAGRGAGGKGMASPHNFSAMAATSTADKWDAVPLLLVDSADMRKLLNVPAGQRYISAENLRNAKIQPPGARSPATFMLWTQQLVFKPDSELSPLEKQGMEMFNRLRAYEDHAAGRRLEILPLPDSEKKQWISLESLMRSTMDDQTDPDGVVRELRDTFYRMRTAYLAHSPAEFNEASHKFLGMLREMGPKLGAYPASNKIDLEVAYNHWAPFRFAWALMTVACIAVLLNMGSRWKAFYPVGLAAYLCGMAAMIVGFIMRVAISGRAPVTNMYESVIYVGFGAAAIGLALEMIYRKRFIAVAAAAVSAVALILADNAPTVLDPSLQPLQPVLRNNFWLVTHVMTITLSYAAFALTMGIANITLGFFLVRSQNRPAIEALSRFTYRTMQVGVILLATGTFLGGMWAAYSWGRFWGWDPKEVWALIALLGYLAVLHARYAGWVQHRGLAALAVGCFSLVMVAWYGVNFVLGAGLHSYGFGGGGKEVIGTLLGAQSLFVAFAMWRSRRSAMPSGVRLRIAPISTSEFSDAPSAEEAA